MSESMKCRECGDEISDPCDLHPGLCCDCHDAANPQDNDDEPETEQDRVDAAGDDLFHSMRDDGEL